MKTITGIINGLKIQEKRSGETTQVDLQVISKDKTEKLKLYGGFADHLMKRLRNGDKATFRYGADGTIANVSIEHRFLKKKENAMSYKTDYED
jgi:hypothetical protein